MMSSILKTAWETYQIMMKWIFKYQVTDMLKVYMDNIIVMSNEEKIIQLI